MGLKAMLDNLDDLEEVYRDQYLPDAGKFILDIEDIDAHPKVRGLVTANTANARKRDEYKAKVAALETRLADMPEDFDPEEWVRLRAAADPSHKGGPDEHQAALKKLYEDRIVALRNDSEKRDNVMKEKLVAAERTIDNLLVDDRLMRAMVDANIDKDLMDGAGAVIRRSIKVVRDDGEQPRAIVETDLGEVEIDSYVQSWTQTDKGRKYRAKAEGDDPRGVSSKMRNGEENPFDTKGGKVKINLQRAQEFILKDPIKARQMAQAAGYTITW